MELSPPTHLKELYDAGDLRINVSATKFESFIKVFLIMYLCKFGQQWVWLVMKKSTDKPFLYVPGDLVYKVEVTKILQLVLAVPDKYLCKFRLNP